MIRSFVRIPRLFLRGGAALVVLLALLYTHGIAADSRLTVRGKKALAKHPLAMATTLIEKPPAATKCYETETILPHILKQNVLLLWHKSERLALSGSGALGGVAFRRDQRPEHTYIMLAASQSSSTFHTSLIFLVRAHTDTGS